MTPQFGQAAFRIAFYIAASAVVLLLFLPKGSAEFSVTVLTLGVGLTFIGVIVILLRYVSR